MYNPEIDKKTKLDHLAEMLLNVVHVKCLPFRNVLMDSWYAAQKIMALIDNLGKIYYCPLKINRLVDDSSGLEKYKRIEHLTWKNSELVQGKLIKIKKFPKDKKVKLFRVNISTDKTEYIATNDLEQKSNNKIKPILKTRWKIE